MSRSVLFRSFTTSKLPQKYSRSLFCSLLCVFSSRNKKALSSFVYFKYTRFGKCSLASSCLFLTQTYDTRFSVFLVRAIKKRFHRSCTSMYTRFGKCSLASSCLFLTQTFNNALRAFSVIYFLLVMLNIGRSPKLKNPATAPQTQNNAQNVMLSLPKHPATVPQTQKQCQKRHVELAETSGNCSANAKTM